MAILYKNWSKNYNLDILELYILNRVGIGVIHFCHLGIMDGAHFCLHILTQTHPGSTTGRIDLQWMNTLVFFWNFGWRHGTQKNYIFGRTQEFKTFVNIRFEY